jgi:hypothetical protein
MQKGGSMFKPLFWILMGVLSCCGMEKIPQPISHFPIGNVASCGDYAADISMFRLYLRNAQMDMSLDLQGINPEGFAFNDDCSILAAFGCFQDANSHGY